MRTLGVLLGLTLALAVDATAVPSFVRQTGMSCNQCHITYGAPVPNFTFTGKMFRMNGYRLPFNAEKIEAGEEGALNGNRLAMSIWPYLSVRYQSQLAAQSRAPGASEWGKVTSNPTSRLSIFPSGAFGDHFALWTELYVTPDGSTTNQWGQGIVSYDEFDLRATAMREWGTIGLAFSNQGVREVGGFGPWPAGVTDHFNGRTWRGWSHINRGTFSLYGFFGQKLFATVGAGPGDDNLEWGRNSYQAQVAYAPLNSDARELWFVSSVQFGDDGLPLVTTYVPSKDGELRWRYLDDVAGISDTRPSGAPYLSTDMDHFVRSTSEIRYGFTNHGAHSLEANARVSLNSETYRDGAEATNHAVGGALRYAYNHTWGVDVVVDKAFRYRFQDGTGITRDIPNDLSYITYLSYRPTMNMLLYFSFANSQSLNLAAPVLTGKSWSVTVDLLF
jgi:hypothetical protein